MRNAHQLRSSSVSGGSSSSVNGPPVYFPGAPASIQALIVARWASVGLRASPGGISFAASFWYSRLFSAEPGSMTLPFLPPLRIKGSERKSSSAGVAFAAVAFPAVGFEQRMNVALELRRRCPHHARLFVVQRCNRDGKQRLQNEGGERENATR